MAPPLSWLDLARTGAFRRHVYDAALTRLRAVGHESGLDEAGCAFLGIPEAWDELRGTPIHGADARRLLTAFVDRHSVGWWDCADAARVALSEREDVEESVVDTPPAEWAAGFRPRRVEVHLHKLRCNPPPGWVLCPPLNDRAPLYGLRVLSAGGTRGDWLVTAELAAILAACTTGYHHRWWSVSHALLMEEDRRRMVAEVYAVGGAEAAAQALVECLRR